MAEKPRDARQKSDEQQPKRKRDVEPAKSETETEPPQAIQKDVAVEDRFQSTDN
jgi:hypothetical protein